MSNIRLTGAPNFRDLGGYATRDGRIVKRGLLFRSGESSRLTEPDIDQLRALDAKLIVDLRSEKERAVTQIRWPFASDTELLTADIAADLRAGNQLLVELLINDPTPRGAGVTMETTYHALPHALAPTLTQISRRIVEEDKLPVIFHCTLGRDRAGITAAMLLYALGVPRDTLIADYMRTNIHIDAAAAREITQVFLKKHQIDAGEEVLDMLTFTRIENFHAALRSIADKYGTVDDYLLAIGIDTALQERLRERLLEPAKT